MSRKTQNLSTHTLLFCSGLADSSPIVGILGKLSLSKGSARAKSTWETHLDPGLE